MIIFDTENPNIVTNLHTDIEHPEVLILKIGTRNESGKGFTVDAAHALTPEMAERLRDGITGWLEQRA